MGVLNTDLAKQLGTPVFGARLWRLAPGQASTTHRHRQQTELYVFLEGTGRIRIEDELLTLAPLSALTVDPDTVRQIFNDTETDALWLVVGTPAEAANTLEMTSEQLAEPYPTTSGATTRTRSTAPRSSRRTGASRFDPPKVGENCD